MARHLHSILPANGAPVTRQGTEHVRQLYEQYVRYRSLSNWKFWIVSGQQALHVKTELMSFMFYSWDSFWSRF